LFKYNTALTTIAFDGTFTDCTALTSIPTGLFKYNTGLTEDAFSGTFENCTSLTAIPATLFLYNTALTTGAFSFTFQGCTTLATIPTDLFRYNVNITHTAFYSTFRGCTVLASIPAYLFRYNTSVTGTTSFTNAFRDCPKLQLNANIFYAEGEQMTRFLDKSIGFNHCFDRATFTGSQGIAPDLWNCDFGERMILNAEPEVAWSPGEIITGQDSGATAKVVEQISSSVYHIYLHSCDVILHPNGFNNGEKIGVNGVPTKIAQQTSDYPHFSEEPFKIGCFLGTGNSITSISNYGSIPLYWRYL
jgi:hypothetical protein